MGKKRIVQQIEPEVAEKEKGLQAGAKKITQLPAAHMYISASYNNTLISVCDADGNVIAWSSAGSLGFKGPKKATPYAATKVVEDIFTKLGGTQIGKVTISVEGVGGGRDAAIRAFASRGLDIVTLRDTTPIPHNGCRPPKARRV